MTVAEPPTGSTSSSAEFQELAEDRPPRLDEIFGVLQNERRRLILRYLDEHDGETAIGDLAEHVAAIENDIPRAELRSKQRKRVYISLYQSHLPKLDDAGAVTYDQDRGTVEEGPAIEEFQKVLRRQDDVEPESSELRTGVSLAGSILLASVLTVGSMTDLVGTSAFRLLAGAAIVAVAVLLAVGLFGLPTN